VSLARCERCVVSQQGQSRDRGPPMHLHVEHPLPTSITVKVPQCQELMHSTQGWRRPAGRYHSARSLSLCNEVASRSKCIMYSSTAPSFSKLRVVCLDLVYYICSTRSPDILYFGSCRPQNRVIARSSLDIERHLFDL
jgi:hypothetical protein